MRRLIHSKLENSKLKAQQISTLPDTAPEPGKQTQPAAIVLAAGSSTRLGRPKQTLLLNGEPLLARALRVAAEAGLGPLFLVVSPGLDLSRLDLHPAYKTVINAAQEGMASSIRCGVEAAQASGVSGVVLMTCDQIALTPQHLQALCAQPTVPSGSAYAGKIGIPAYFPAPSFAALLELRGDTGARELLRAARPVLAEELHFDIDTEEDVRRAAARLIDR